jgi:type IV secretion system protein VirB4
MSIARERAAQREKPIGDHLPYLAQVDDHTIVTRDGMAMQVIRLDGLPFETIEAAQLDARKASRDAMLRAVSSARFSLVHNVIRASSPTRSARRWTRPGANASTRGGYTSTIFI